MLQFLFDLIKTNFVLRVCKISKDECVAMSRENFVMTLMTVFMRNEINSLRSYIFVIVFLIDLFKQ